MTPEPPKLNTFGLDDRFRPLIVDPMQTGRELIRDVDTRRRETEQFFFVHGATSLGPTTFNMPEKKMYACA